VAELEVDAIVFPASTTENSSSDITTENLSSDHTEHLKARRPPRDAVLGLIEVMKDWELDYLLIGTIHESSVCVAF
jgi:hypothetical protein